MPNRRLPTWITRADVADLAGVGVFAGLSLAFVFGAVMPSVLREHNSVVQAERVAQAHKQASGLAAGIRAATDDISRTRVRLAAAPLQIRPVSALNERLATLVALANECGLGVQDLKPGDPVRGKKFTTTALELGGRGGYGQVTRFLHQLSRCMPDMSVGSFKLSDASGEGRYLLELRWTALLGGTGEPRAASVATVEGSSDRQ